jgi:flagellar motor switch protein FliN/FliY
MSEILSQEQIDSLLGQKDMLSVNGEAASSAGNMKNYDALRNAVDLFGEQAASVVSTILNKTVTFQTLSCEKTDPAKAKQSVEPPMLLVSVPFRAGLSGAFQFIIAKKNVAHVSDLMMMGDGNAAYTEDHKDAIVELYSQIMGAFATALGSQFGEQVSVDTISAVEFDFAAPSFQMDASDTAVIKGVLGDAGEYQMLLMIPDDLSNQLMKKMNAGPDQAAGGQETGAGLFGAGADDLNISGGDESGSFVETSITGDSVRTSSSHENIDMLLDVELDVYIELGRTNLSIKRILELSPGSVVELDRMAGEPVDLLVNEKVVAKGEVVVVDENFGIRIVSLVSAEDRIKSLK